MLPNTNPQQASAAAEDWRAQHAAAAWNEGWVLVDTYGSDHGDWQIQRIDSPPDDDDTPLPPCLVSDEVAHQIIACGREPHHTTILEFLEKYSPMEFAAVLAQHKKAA